MGSEESKAAVATLKSNNVSKETVMGSALVQKLMQEYSPGKQTKYYLTPSEAKAFVFALFKELKVPISKKDASLIVEQCLNDDKQFTLEEFTQLVRDHIPSERLTTSLKVSVNSYSLVEIPKLPGVHSYHQLCCMECSRDPNTCNPAGDHYECKFCSREFHTNLYQAHQPDRSYTPNLCPECVCEHSLCMMCGPVTQHQPRFLISNQFQGPSGHCSVCPKLY